MTWWERDSGTDTFSPPGESCVCLCRLPHIEAHIHTTLNPTHCLRLDLLLLSTYPFAARCRCKHKQGKHEANCTSVVKGTHSTHGQQERRRRRRLRRTKEEEGKSHKTMMVKMRKEKQNTVVCSLGHTEATLTVLPLSLSRVCVRVLPSRRL